MARFLGLLELFREGLVAFEQAEALGDLHVRWTGPTTDDEADAAASAAGAEWDEQAEEQVVDLTEQEDDA